MKCHLAAKFVEKNSKLNYKTHRNFSNRSGQQQIQLTFNLVLLILIEQNKKPQHQKCILVLKIKFIRNFQLFTSIKSHLHHHKMHYEVFFFVLLFCIIFICSALLTATLFKSSFRLKMLFKKQFLNSKIY